VTGTIAAIYLLTALSQLWETGYGRELLAKIALLVVLIGLGALNRRRLKAGRTIRDVVRAEVVLIVAVLGVSGVLVDGVPPVSAASGPFSASKRLGPLDLELTLDPARAGPNELHLYLFDAKTGAPFTRTKELRVTARLADKQIGPLPLTLRRSGDGHFTADTVQLSPGGDWTLNVADRVSDFDEYTTTLEVSIR
jgi:copper transport protein